MNKLIRLASTDDTQEILDIYTPYIEHSAISFEFEVPTHEDFKNRINKIIKKYPWLVCLIDGKIVGYAYACEHRARIAYNWSVESSVYLSDKFHGQGLGKELYIELFKQLRMLGFYNVFAGITLPHPASHALHLSLGFEEIGVYKQVGFKNGEWYDTLWYQLLLQEGGVPKELKDS